MRVFLDTNVLLAAFASHGTCQQLFEHCEEHHILVTTPFVLIELKRHLPTKFGFTHAETEEAVNVIGLLSHSVKPTSLPKGACRDMNDLPILGAALAGRCDCLVTGDKDLLSLQTFRGIRIVTPSAFWELENNGRKGQA